jgi:hypothetical protein
MQLAEWLGAATNTGSAGHQGGREQQITVASVRELSSCCNAKKSLRSRKFSDNYNDFMPGG